MTLSSIESRTDGLDWLCFQRGANDMTFPFRKTKSQELSQEVSQELRELLQELKTQCADASRVARADEDPQRWRRDRTPQEKISGEAKTFWPGLARPLVTFADSKKG